MGMTVHQPGYEIPASNSGIVLSTASNLQIVPLEVPLPKPGQVQIQMKATGIGSSDIQLWKSGLPPYSMLEQLVLGYEGAGYVTAVNTDERHPGQPNIDVGDRVVIEPCVPCSDCSFCLDGRYNLCSRIIQKGSFPFDGLFAKYVTHPIAWLHRIPDTVSFSEAALLDPLCIAIAAIDRSGVRMGESLLVTGTSPIALLVLLVAKATSIGPVVLLDTHAGRLDLAKSFGADAAFSLDPKWSEDTLAQAICAELGSEGADSSIECTGTAPTLRVAIKATRQGGICCRTGPGEPDQVVPISAFALRDITLRGVHRHHHTYPRAIELIASERINVKPLITHE
ncbi:chaperonin 10-like protein [Zychaea mexicana]|uniref:chaperonin 10-like protein n=1 Tax=Zychaea mexicana TaxID=64656 RepID=UPI0022FE3F34|nr:chaperonin 10-like protein [Zychaea mexicana]KAI9490441.1 chaperonin 10-like protein [Zychaea mexicana]